MAANTQGVGVRKITWAELAKIKAGLDKPLAARKKSVKGKAVKGKSRASKP